MKNLSKFQLIILIVFVAFILLGVIVFALGRSSSRVPQTTVLLWGTIFAPDFAKILQLTGLDQNPELKINYVQKNSEDFEEELLEALALGAGPDLFFIDSESVLEQQDKIFIVPFESFSERTFKDSFIEGSEIFLTDEGVLALPISVDPLVMYWNRDIFSTAGVVNPPKFWEEFYDLSVLLTAKDTNFNIARSAVGFGEYTNVNNAFEILSTLIMQAGSPIIEKRGERFENVLEETFGLPALPAERALSFYTEFSNPSKIFYSWNRSLPWSQNFFLSGDLGIYFGLAGEYSEISSKNPNLNFDVTAIPQTDSSRKLTYGSFEGLAISKRSSKVNAALKTAAILAGRDASLVYSQITGLPPVRRDLLSQRPERAAMEVFYNSAVFARAWLVPDKNGAKEIFKNMIESVTGGRSRARESVSRAANELGLLIRNLNN